MIETLDRKPQHIIQIDDAYLLKSIAAGKSLRAIARESKCSHETVSLRLKELGCSCHRIWLQHGKAVRI